MELWSRLGLGFDLLHDVDNRTGTDYGIVLDTPGDVRAVEERLGLDLPDYNDTTDWRLPMPARVVIAGDGSVYAIEVQADHALRTEPAATLQVLRSMGQG